MNQHNPLVPVSSVNPIVDNYIQLFPITFTRIILGLSIYIIGHLLVSYFKKLTNKVYELEKQLSNMTSQIEDQFNDKVNISVFNLQTDINNSIKELKCNMFENMRIMTENIELLENMTNKQKKKIIELEYIMESNADSLTKELSVVSEKCDMLIENVEDNNRQLSNNINELKTELDTKEIVISYGNQIVLGTKYSINKNILTNMSQLYEKVSSRMEEFDLHSLKYFTKLKELDLKY